MRLPRDVSGEELSGTLAAILADVAQHFGLSRDQLLSQLFGDG